MELSKSSTAVHAAVWERVRVLPLKEGKSKGTEDCGYFFCKSACIFIDYALYCHAIRNRAMQMEVYYGEQSGSIPN